MKKFYSLVLALVACATTAFAASITLNIDDATRVKVLVDDTDYAVVTGANTITSESDYGSVTIQTTSSDYGLTSVTAKNATGAAQSPESIYSDKCYLNLGSYTDGWTYTVTSFSYAELRTASCKVYVDDASKVSLTRYNGSPITLEDGVNTVAFIPSTESKAESPFGLRGESTLYAVKINGVEQTASWGSYYLNVADGDSVTILANFPDVDVPVQFIAGDAKSAGFITAVGVDDAPVTNWADDDFTVKLGSTVTFDYNTADYSKDSIFVDGEKIYNYSSSYSFVVTTTTTHTVKYYAHKYATYDITINIDDPSHITLYKGYSYNNQEITGLVAGENTVSLAETITGISFKAASGCWVKSFTDAEGNDYTTTSSYSLISTSAGDEFTITTGAANRYATAVFFIDSVSKATYGGGITFPDRTSPLVFQEDSYSKAPVAEDGYNTFAFDPEYDSTMLVAFYGAEHVYLYVNDSLVQPDYAGSTNYTLRLDDEDVVKAFLAAAPDTFSVTFKETEEYKFIDITEDIVSRLAALPANPFEGEALTGTQVTFSVTEGGVVYKNDEKIEPDEDGIYSATVTSNVVFEIKAPETAIENTKTVLNRNVYTVEGILLLKDATDAQIKALPAGLYIINGASTCILQH